MEQDNKEMAPCGGGNQPEKRWVHPHTAQLGKKVNQGNRVTTLSWTWILASSRSRRQFPNRARGPPYALQLTVSYTHLRAHETRRHL
eukprot:11989643-Prorocentrum_lima.AAC.1